MEILLSALVMLACAALLGVGLLFKRRKNTLKGSCGGLSSGEMGPDMSCPSCEGDPARCPETDQRGSKGKPGVASKLSISFSAKNARACGGRQSAWDKMLSVVVLMLS